MRKKIVAGNWKMNGDLSQTKDLLENIKKELSAEPIAGVSILVAPPFVNLQTAVEAVKDTAIEVAAQNVHYAESGAFTGEISTSMLAAVGVKTVILGHSERRKYFKETPDLLAKKARHALKDGFKILFCIGESLEEREKEKHFEVVEKQLSESLYALDEKFWEQIVLAYEPVWAIGTGRTASAEQAQEMHAFIRKSIAANYSEKTAEQVSILYGGSVKPDNAADIFAKPDVDGGLIGGASLKALDFIGILKALY